MKKVWLITVSIILVSGLALIGCDNGGNGETVEITFNAGNGEFSNGLGFRRVEIPKGGTVTPPTDVELKDHKLAGWTTDLEEDGTILTNSTRHNEDTTYYAIWEQDIFNVTGSWDYIGVNPSIAADDINVWMWEITSEAMTAVLAAIDGSVLRLHFDAREGRGEDRGGWSIGSIGTATSALDANVIGLWTLPGTGLVYYVDAEIDWIHDTLDDNKKLTVFVPVNNGDRLTKIELMEPKAARDPGDRPGVPAPPTDDLKVPPKAGEILVGAIDIVFGYFGDPTVGKGEIAGTAIDQIKALYAELQDKDESAILRFYVRNLLDNNRTSWGIGQINGEQVLSGSDGRENPLNVRANDINLSTIMELLGTGSTLDLNPYNEHAIVLIELWRGLPGEGDSISIMLGDTKVDDIVVIGRSVSVRMFTDGSGYEFVGTGGGHRHKFAWFTVDFGDYKLSDFTEVTFTFEVVSGMGSSATSRGGRRLALVAQSTEYGNAALSAHELPSGDGYLAVGQVTHPMDGIDPDYGEPLEITLEIDPDSIGDLDDHNILHLIIYEHTDPTSFIRISNIRFIEP